LLDSKWGEVLGDALSRKYVFQKTDFAYSVLSQLTGEIPKLMREFSNSKFRRRLVRTNQNYHPEFTGKLEFEPSTSRA
jgi:hypothetical protein